jgi:hypothetical protein
MSHVAKTGLRGSNSRVLEVILEGENVGIAGRNRDSEGTEGHREWKSEVLSVKDAFRTSP